MNDNNQSVTASARRVRSAAAFIGGAATLALMGIALGHPDGTVSAARTRHGDTAEYTSPTQTAMKLGLTTVESTESAPATPPPTPATPFAAPAVKAGK